MALRAFLFVSCFATLVHLSASENDVLSADVGELDASGVRRRVPTVQAKQITYLLDENKKLKGQIDILQLSLETPELLEHRKALAASVAQEAEENRKAAEAEVAIAKAKVDMMRLGMQTSEAETEKARINAAALAASSEAARLALEESRENARNASIKKDIALAEAEMMKQAAIQVENQRLLAEATARQWDAMQASSAHNASVARAEADKAAAIAKTAEEERRTAEIAAREADSARVSSALRSVLAQEAETIRQAALESALSTVDHVDKASQKWREEAEGLRFQLEKAKLALETANESATLKDLVDSANQAREAAADTSKFVSTARADAAAEYALRLKRVEAEMQIVAAQVERAKAEAEAAKWKLDAAAAGERIAEAARGAAAEEAAKQRVSFELAGKEAAIAKAAADEAAAKARDSADRARQVEVQAALKKAESELAARFEREAESRATTSVAELRRADEDRKSALAREAEAVAKAKEADAVARTEASKAATAEFAIAEARALQSAAASKAEAAAARAQEAISANQRVLMELEVAIENRKTAESNNGKAQAEANGASALMDRLRVSLQVATQNATAALHARAAAEAQAATAASLAAAEGAKVEVARFELAASEAKVSAIAAQSRAEAERVTRETTLASARFDTELASKRALMQEEDALVRKREEARQAGEAQLAVDKEQARLATEEKLASVRATTEASVVVARAAAEAEGRIREAKDTEELRAKEAAAAAVEARTRLLDAVREVLFFLGVGALALLKDHLPAVVSAVIAIAAGIYIAREAATLARSELSRWLGQPSLVIETSMQTGVFRVWSALCRLLSCCGSRRGEDDPFDGVVLARDVDARVRILAQSTRQAHSNSAPLRHVLLFGPPGTGKTLVATRMARHCGLDYAIMSGGHVAPLGSRAVAELNAVFEWARSSPKGMLLFIDEAEAFLGSRARTGMSEDGRNAMSALLAATGEPSAHIMLVLASNRPGDLDSAITDRVDETLFLGAPDTPARLALVNLYFNKYIASRSPDSLGSQTRGWWKKAGPRPLVVEPDVTPALLKQVSVASEGLSGRAIAKLMVAAQASAYGLEARKFDGACIVTRAHILESLQAELDKLERRGMRAGAAAIAAQELIGASPARPAMHKSATTAESAPVTTSATPGRIRMLASQRSPQAMDPVHVFWGQGRPADILGETSLPLEVSRDVPAPADASSGDPSGFVVPALGTQEMEHDFDELSPGSACAAPELPKGSAEWNRGAGAQLPTPGTGEVPEAGSSRGDDRDSPDTGRRNLLTEEASGDTGSTRVGSSSKSKK